MLNSEYAWTALPATELADMGRILRRHVLLTALPTRRLVYAERHVVIDDLFEPVAEVHPFATLNENRGVLIRRTLNVSDGYLSCAVGDFPLPDALRHFTT